jgi:hypothetical protein
MPNNSSRSAKKPSPRGGVDWFAGTSSAALANVTVSIAKDGRLRYNAGFLHAHKLQAYPAVALGYDARRQRILTRFVKAAQGEGVLVLHKHDGGKVVNAKAFFTANGLDVRRYVGRYTPVVVVAANGTGPTFAIALGATAKKRQPWLASGLG